MIKIPVTAKPIFLIAIMAIFVSGQLCAKQTPQSIVSDDTNIYQDPFKHQCITPSESCADFTITRNELAPHDDPYTQILPLRSCPNISESLDIDQNFYNDIRPLCKNLNNAYIRINAHNNVDMRMTGSTTLLGKVTLPYTQKNFFTGTPMIIGTDGGIGIGNLLVPGDVTITGSLYVTGGLTLVNTNTTYIFGDKRIQGQKTIGDIATSPATTPVLTLIFTNPTGTTAPLFHSANVHLQCFISGTVLGVASQFFYDADLMISPATTAGGTPPAVVSISSATTTTIQGTVLPATITATTSGLGTTVVISFGSLLAMTVQSNTLFYEVTSDNITAVF